MQRRALGAAIVISGGLTSLPTTALALAVPSIHHDFHASVSALQWTLSIYSLAYCALLIVGGRVADEFGRARVFRIGVAVWIAGNVAAALAPGSVALILAMGLLGIGSAALTPASLALLEATWQGVSRAKLLSLWAASSAALSGIGPTAGGIITADLSWRWIFWISAAISVATFALAYAARSLGSRAREAAEVDTRGVLLLVAGLTLVSLAVIQGPEWELDSPQTLLVFAIGVVMLAWFVRAERRTRTPLVELPLLRVRAFTGGIVVKLSVNLALTAFFFFMSLYMQEVLGYTPEQAGFALLPLTAPFLVAVPIGRRLGSRFDPRVPILLGLGLSIVSFVLLTSVDKDLHYSDLLPSILLLGVGSGLCVTAMNAAPMNAIADAKAGQAAGILQMTTGLGSVLGITLGGALFQEMHERRLTDFLRAADGRSIPEATQHQLTGALVHSPPAERALARFDTQTAATILRGIREAFVFGVSSTMWLSVGALCVGVVAAITLMRRASLTVSS